jgi:hypothetical protein
MPGMIYQAYAEDYLPFADMLFWRPLIQPSVADLNARNTSSTDSSNHQPIMITIEESA